MAEDRDPNRHPGDANDEESDDFIIIQVEDCPPSNPRNTSNTSSNTSSVKTNDLSSVDSGFDFEDYVEVSYDDVQTEDMRSEEQKRSLYGVRLFQYSPESEGNIYITNEEL